MAVEAVIGDVEFAINEPLRIRWIPVEDSAPLCIPVE